MGKLFLAIVWFCAVAQQAVADNRAARCREEFLQISQIYGGASVPEVEAINQTHLKALTRYTYGASVQDQLNAPGRLGFVAHEAADISGFVVAEQRNSFVNIVSIAVRPDQFKRGAGRDLLEKIYEQASEQTSILDVRVLLAIDDTGAIDFFKKCGFQEVDKQAGRFEEGATSGVLLKRYTSHGNPSRAQAPERERQMAPNATSPTRVLQTIEIPLTELRRIDPTIRPADE